MNKEQIIHRGRKKIQPEHKILSIVCKEREKGSITTKEAMNMLHLKSSTYYRRIKEYKQLLKNNQENRNME